MMLMKRRVIVGVMIFMVALIMSSCGTKESKLPSTEKVQPPTNENSTKNISTNLSQPSIPKEISPEEVEKEKAKAGNLAIAFVQKSELFSKYHGANITVASLEKTYCPGCYDVVITYEMDSIQYQGRRDKATLSLSMSDWKVKETSSTFSPLTQKKSSLSNPASSFCIEKGGKLQIQVSPAGETGICTLPDGTVCDEWKFYRGECGPKVEECATDADCTVPVSYAIKSICPYGSWCAEGTCTIVCPMVDESYSSAISCKQDTDCDCSSYVADDAIGCRCITGRCAATVRS